ncbi:MAG: hypothetical protein HKN76_17075 [Saprospiraceae bacterium]|nr:hypothetical protein [Saprospiraceae bacterium]
MKLRLKENTIRIRLSIDEVNLLVVEGQVAGRTFLSAKNYLEYSLRLAKSLGLTYLDQHLILELPRETLKDWNLNQTVGFNWKIPIDESTEEIQITLEKDFKCLTIREGEDESNLYDHPDPSQHKLSST